jgi:CRP-like cAMP-binding protein
MDDRNIARLSACGLFSGVEASELKKSLARGGFSVRNFEEGAVIASAGTVCSSLMVLLEGEARAQMTNDEGKTFTVEILREKEAVAAAILFSDRSIMPVTLVAVRRTSVAILERETLVNLCLAHRSVLEALLKDMGGRLVFLAEKLRALQFATLRERLADWLLRRSQLADSPLVHLETSKERLAELFGVARPSLSRELGKMEKLKCIAVDGRGIRILDRAGLGALRSR